MKTFETKSEELNDIEYKIKLTALIAKYNSKPYKTIPLIICASSLLVQYAVVKSQPIFNKFAKAGINSSKAGESLGAAIVGLQEKEIIIKPDGTEVELKELKNEK